MDPRGHEVVVEGQAKIAVTPGVFFSKHQILQRDLSVVVLRVLRRVKDGGGLGNFVFSDGDASPRENGAAGTARAPEWDAQYPSRTVLRVCDALAGGGVRAIRYALEAGPTQVVANDQSKEACEAICGNARLSGIDSIAEMFTATTATTTVGSSSSSRESSAAGDQQFRNSLPRNDTPVGNHRPRRVTAAVIGIRKEDDGNDACGSFRCLPERHQQPAVHTKLSSSTLVVNACTTETATLHPAGSDKPASPEETHRESGPHQQPSLTVRLSDANAFLLQGGHEHQRRACCFPESDTNGSISADCAAKAGTSGGSKWEREAEAGHGRAEKGSDLRWDLVDVDPFGSCMPFLNAAVTAVADGGVVAAAATDLATLCGKNGPEACANQYGANVADLPYSKEAALRILLLRMEVLARRRGRRIVPLLCVALDFYVRLFVMIVPRGDNRKINTTSSGDFTAQAPLMVTQCLDSPAFSLHHRAATGASCAEKITTSGDSSIATASGGPSRENFGDDEFNGDERAEMKVNGKVKRVVDGTQPDGKSVVGSCGSTVDAVQEEKGITDDEGDRRKGRPSLRCSMLPALEDELVVPKEEGGSSKGEAATWSAWRWKRPRHQQHPQQQQHQRRRRRRRRLENPVPDHHPDTHRTQSPERNRRNDGALNLGPFWPGPLFHSGFLAAVLNEVRVPVTPSGEGSWKEAGCADGRTPLGGEDALGCSQSTLHPTSVTLATRRQLLFLLEALAGELENCPLFYSLPDIAAKLERRTGKAWGRGGDAHIPTVEAVQAELRAAGHACSGSHVDPRAIKTRAPFAAVEAAVQCARTAQRQRRHPEAAPTAGSLEAARAHISDHAHKKQKKTVSSFVSRTADDQRSHDQDRHREAKQQTQHINYEGPRSLPSSPEQEETIAKLAVTDPEPGPRTRAEPGSTDARTGSWTGPGVVLETGPGTGTEGEDELKGFKAGPRVPVGRPLEEGSAQRFPHLTVAALEAFVQESLMAWRVDAISAAAQTAAVVGIDGGDKVAGQGGCEIAGSEALFFVVRRGSRCPGRATGAATCRGQRLMNRGDDGDMTRDREMDAVEVSLARRFPGHVRFFENLIEAAAAAKQRKSIEVGGTILLLGGTHDAGFGGVCLGRPGSRIVGVIGSDRRLPVIEGRPRSHAIRCSGEGVSLQSLSVRGGTAVRTSIVGRAAAVAPTLTPLVGSLEAPVTTLAKGVGSGVAGRADGDLIRGETKQEMRRKLPRLVFDRGAAEAVVIATATAAASRGSRAGTVHGVRERGRGGPHRRVSPTVREGVRISDGQRARRGGGEGRGGAPVHAVSVESGSASIQGCDITSVLPSACVCVSAAASRVSLAGTRLFDGRGAGLLVCGKAEASATDCTFEGVGAAGVEARGGSIVTLSRCLVSCSGKSGVFIQGFSRGVITHCDVVGSALAGVEVLRNACVTVDACCIHRSRRGGVLVHLGSEATLRDCRVSQSCLAGVDARTGAEATLESCSITDGKASGIYVSAGGRATVGCTVFSGNRLAAIEIAKTTAMSTTARRRATPPISTTTTTTTTTTVPPKKTTALLSSSCVAPVGERVGVAAETRNTTGGNYCGIEEAENDEGIGGEAGASVVGNSSSVRAVSYCRVILLRGGKKNVMEGNGVDGVMDHE